MSKRKNRCYMQLTDKEIDSLLTQSPDVRYTYSLKRIADSGYIWYLSSDDDSYMCIQDGDIRLFPVWPFKEYAEKYVSCMRKGHKCNCSKLDLEEFSDKLVDYLCETGMPIGVFPVVENDYGKVISINNFAEDLSVELENYQ